MELEIWSLTKLFVCVILLIHSSRWCEGQTLPPSNTATCMRMVAKWSRMFIPQAGKCYMEQLKQVRSLGVRINTFNMTAVRDFEMKRQKIENINCTLKCAAVRVGMLADDGRLDEMVLATFVDDNVPPEFSDAVWSVFATCRSLSAGELAIPDEECSKHGLLFKCVSAGLPMVFKACYPNSRRLVPTYTQLQSATVG